MMSAMNNKTTLNHYNDYSFKHMNNNLTPPDVAEGYTIAIQRKQLIIDIYKLRRNYIKRLHDDIEGDYGNACFNRSTPTQLTDSIERSAKKAKKSYIESYQNYMHSFNKVHGKGTAQAILNDFNNYYL